ncbi:MAG: ribonuclease R [Coraliomargaritaceae bacterium]
MDVRKALLKLLRAPDYVPMRDEALLAVLRLSPDKQKQARKLIRSMINRGELVYVKKGRLCIPSDADLVSGYIHFRQSGSAFIIPESESKKKGVDGHPVAAEDTGTALHGDLVLGRVLERPQKKSFDRYRRGRSKRVEPSGRPSLRVIRVIKRARDTIVGTLQKARHTHFVIPDDPRIIQDFLVPPPANCGLQPLPSEGDKVVIKLLEWKQRHLNPEAEIIQVLGRTHEPDAEFKGILHKYSLEPKFPGAVEEETKQLPNTVPEEDYAGRMDCRDLFTFTIDPDDAKDFDDALSLEELEEGNCRIGIHIADVSAYVKPDSALDKEAQKRGNSTYLVGTVIPMLPHALSNGLCSLVEAQDRLTKSVFITFNSKAGIEKVDYARTVIRSNKRLTYAQALAFLKNDDLNEVVRTPLPPKHQTGSTGRSLKDLNEEELLNLQEGIRKLWEVAEQLRKRRFKSGSLDLEMNEIKIYVDPDGYADRIEKQHHDESHQLIEEFMLAANEAIARIMKQQRFPCIYRVHDEPEDEKLQELREAMSSHGIRCGNLSKAREMSLLLQTLKEHPQGHTLKTHVLRSLKQAQYRASPDGHYGLAKNDYTHFTSPIRRYSDLVVHRVLDAYLHKTGASSAPHTPDIRYTQGKLESLGDHLCITERNSVDAERESVKTKLLEFYERQLKEENRQTFEAVVTDIKNHGLYIEIIDSMAFGMIHISTLDDDFYHVDPDGQRVVGRRSGKTYSVGDTVAVQVERVDRFKRQIDFRIARSEKSAQGHNPKKGTSVKKRPTTAKSAKALTELRKQRRTNRQRKGHSGRKGQA